jgi:DNA (cytosine-5)-methyltransferase 1
VNHFKRGSSMQKRLKLLDLFCGAGGASMGYHLAGFEVVGVDLNPQPNYPFQFVRADALTFPLDGFDAVVGSPPCPGYSKVTAFHRGARTKHPLLVEPLRERFQASGLPYVIENVEGAPLHDPLLLCGTMFGLRSIRHRLFESNIPLVAPHHPDLCTEHLVRCAGPAAIPKGYEYWSIGGHFGQKDRAQREGLGIDWMMTVDEIKNAIPPAYTRWIGEQLVRVLCGVCAAPGCQNRLHSPVGAGRRARFCSGACRVRAHRARSCNEIDARCNEIIHL